MSCDDSPERLAAHFSPDLLLVVDPQGTLRFASLAAERLLGIDPRAHEGTSVFEWVHPDDLAMAAGGLSEAVRTTGAHLPVHIRLRGTDGLGWVHCEVTGETVELDSGMWVVLSVRPVEGRTALVERRDAVSELILSSSPLCASVGWLEVDDVVRGVLAALAGIVGADVATLAMAGDGADTPTVIEWSAIEVEDGASGVVAVPLWSEDQLTSAGIGFTAGLASMPATEERDRLLRAGARLAVEVPLPGSGTCLLRLAFECDRRRWDDANADLVRLLGTTLVSAVTRCRMEHELYEKSRRDPLTGLLNGPELVALLTERVERADRAGRPESLGVIYGDLDGFKAVNDTLGHAVGDRLIRSVAEAVLVEVREGDLVARMGGDEFVVVCGRIDGPHDLQAVAERVAEGVERLATGEAPLSISLGTAVARPGESAKSLLARADMAMLRTKRAERSRS